jgi:hypothetical protein
MFTAFRMIGWFFLTCGFLFLVRDLFGSVSTDHGFHPKTLAQIWDILSPGASDDFEGSLRVRFSAWVWWPLTAVLNTWAFAVMFLLGFALETAMRERAAKPAKRVKVVGRA